MLAVKNQEIFPLIDDKNKQNLLVEAFNSACACPGIFKILCLAFRLLFSSGGLFGSVVGGVRMRNDVDGNRVNSFWCDLSASVKGVGTLRTRNNALWARDKRLATA